MDRGKSRPLGPRPVSDNRKSLADDSRGGPGWELFEDLISEPASMADRLQELRREWRKEEAAAERVLRWHARRQPADARDAEKVLRLNRVYAIVTMGSAVRILKETTDQHGRHRAVLLRINDFRLELANQKVKAESGELLQIADLWLAHPKRREYRGLIFAPGQDHPQFYNLWRGFSVGPQPGDCSLFKHHLLVNVCCGDKALFVWLWSWIADLVQNPGRLIGVGVVLQGPEGAGKSIVGKVIGSLFPTHHVAVDHACHVTGRFNSHLEAALLLQADDAVLTDDKAAWGRLNALVTAQSHLIERKGADPFEVESCLRVLITSNDKWAVPASFDARRWAVFKVGAGKRGNRAFFEAMMKQLDDGGREALLDELFRCDLSAVDLRAIPATAALAEQKLQTASSDERWWHEVLVEGSQTLDGVWHATMTTNALYHSYLRIAEQIGRRERSLQTELGIALRRLCPSLRRRRASAGTRSRPWMYEFPSLDVARAEFEGAIGHRLDWPADEGAGGSRLP